MTQKQKLMNWMERANNRDNEEFDISTLKYEEGMWWVKNYTKQEDPGGSFWEYFSFDSWGRVLR